jgi:hypothetical protein
MLSTVWLGVAAHLSAQLVVMPGADDAPLRDAAHEAGIVVIDDAVVRENLALLGDTGCAAAETRCLARLAMVSDALATLAAIPVDGDDDRRDAVIVTAAGERRRVQSTITALSDDVAFALAAPAGARLRLRLDGPDHDQTTFFVDDETVPAAAAGVMVRPGEHRVQAQQGTRVARAVVVVAAGESVWLTFTPRDLAPGPASTPPTTTDNVDHDDIGLMIGAGLAVGGTAAALGMLGLAGAAVAAAEASDVQTTRAAEAATANAWSVGAGVALAVAVAGAGLTVWSLAHGDP